MGGEQEKKNIAQGKKRGGERRKKIKDLRKKIKGDQTFNCRTGDQQKRRKTTLKHKKGQSAAPISRETAGAFSEKERVTLD